MSQFHIINYVCNKDQRNRPVDSAIGQRSIFHYQKITNSVLYLAKKPKTQPGLSSKVGGEFFLVGECGLECSGEFKGVPVGEKLCPLVGLWITLGVKLEIEPISEADPVLILEKSEKKKCE